MRRTLATALFLLSPVAWADTVGQLEVLSTPPGATVRLDGITLGRTPLSAQVSTGPHQLELNLQGYPVKREKINVAERGLSLTLNLAPDEGAPTEVRITGLQGWRAYCDGRSIGYLPQSLALPAGPHTFLAVAPDGRRIQQTVDIQFDGETAPTVDLTPRGGPSGLED